MLNNPSAYDQMESVELTHWWYRTLHGLIISAIADYAPSDNPVIMDMGCGTGGLLWRLQQEGFTKIQGVDPSEHALKHAHKRGFAAICGSFEKLNELTSPASLDIIIAADVLCYIKPDQRADICRQVLEVLRGNGLFILNLPTFAIFRGIHDLAVGINTRFTPTEIYRLFDLNNWEFCSLRHWPFLLSPIIGLKRTLQRHSLRRFPDQVPKSDLDPPCEPFNTLLYQLCRLEKLLISHPPCGSSTLLVLRKLV